MDFLYGLDNNQYADNNAELVNDLQKEIFIQPKTLNEIYLLASRQMVLQTGNENTGGATFATVEEGNPKKGNRTKEEGPGKEKTRPKGQQRSLPRQNALIVGRRATWQETALIN